MSSTTSNITFYDSSTATIQALQFRGRGFSLAPPIANEDFVIDFMKGADIQYAQDGTVDWTSSTFQIPDMTFDRIIFDDYGRHFVYNGIYKATLQNDGVIQARQMYDAYDHRIGIDFLQAHSNIVSSNIYNSNLETIQINSSNIYNSTNMVSSNIETSNLTVYNNLNVIGNIYGNGQYLTNIPSVSQWTTNGSSIFYNTGNVGINTNTPLKKLDVIGNIRCTQFEGDGSLLTNLPISSSQWDTSGANIYYNDGAVGIGTSIGFGSLKLRVEGSTQINGSFAVSSSSTLFALDVQGATTMAGSATISAIGNGTVKMNLNGTVGAVINAEELNFSFKNALSRNALKPNLLQINSNQDFTQGIQISGNVGIGTAPSQKLDVVGTIKATSFQGDGAGITGLVGNFLPTGAVIYTMGKFSPNNFLICDGLPHSRTTYSNLFNVIVPYQSTITLTLANPCVITWANHPLAVNDIVSFETTGSLPSSIVAFTSYYVSLVVSANTFQISASQGGVSISTLSQSQSGTHTCLNAPFGVPNSTQFYVPNLKGMFIRSWDYDNAVDQTNRAWGSYQADAIITHTHSYDKTNPRSGVTGGGNQDAGNNTYTSTSSGNPSVGTSTETRPKNIALLTCIKT